MVTQIDFQSKGMTVSDAATYLAISKSYLYRLIHERRISFYKPSGSKRAGRVYFKIEDLDAFLFRGRSAADFELATQAEEILISQQSVKRRR
jgi:excisionase family DNA binding protein